MTARDTRLSIVGPFGSIWKSSSNKVSIKSTSSFQKQPPNPNSLMLHHVSSHNTWSPNTVDHSFSRERAVLLSLSFSVFHSVGKRGIIAEEVDQDRQGVVEEVGDKRWRKKQQKNKQQQQNRFSGRPGRSTARAQRAQRLERSTGPVDRNAWLTDPNSRVFWVDRPGRPENPDWQTQLSGFLGRPSRSTGIRKSVDRPGRPTVGFWVKSADPLYEVFKPMFILWFVISAKKY